MGHNLPFDRKYRPVTFSDVLDQEDTVKVLKNLIKNKKFSSPIMFTGIFGGGKTTLARIFARTVLCESVTENLEPCNECPSCLSFLKDSNLAYVEIDAASNSGVDSIRKLREEANLKVLGNSERKVVVIDECHSISKQGNEALLKQLEDNNTNQVYVLCTTNPQNMLETVRSRCLEFPIHKNTPESILGRLAYICGQEEIQFEKSALEIIASETCPHVRNSLKSLDLLSNFGDITDDSVIKHFNLSLNTDILKFLSLVKTDLSKSLEKIAEIASKNDIARIYEAIIRNVVSTCKLKYGVNEFRNSEQKELASKLVETFTQEDLNNFLEELLKRNKYVDKLTLESDVILLNHKLNNSFVRKVVEVTRTVIENPIAEKETSVCEELKDESIDEEVIEPENSELDGTAITANRYKSYPPQLAMMFEKSKKQSSVKSDKPVELNQSVRDFKGNIPKADIKNYLKSKKT